ncbi:nucleotidyltransferase substrate binding protein [bacterium]|nr:nucleotidyltransferase substrate binding protein [bacterium]
MKENLSEYSLEKLKNAFNKLADGAKIADDDLYKDGVIQRFEFTFELLWKMHCKLSGAL